MIAFNTPLPALFKEEARQAGVRAVQRLLEVGFPTGLREQREQRASLRSAERVEASVERHIPFREPSWHLHNSVEHITVPEKVLGPLGIVATLMPGWWTVQWFKTFQNTLACHFSEGTCLLVVQVVSSWMIHDDA